MGSYELGNDISGPIKQEFHEQLNIYQDPGVSW